MGLFLLKMGPSDGGRFLAQSAPLSTFSDLQIRVAKTPLSPPNAVGAGKLLGQPNIMEEL